MSNDKIKQFVCLSGLPRTGSTLLSAILSQNPLIHAEGNSAVCQLMWDMQQSCVLKAREQLAANRRAHTAHDLVSSIPNIYYKDCAGKIIVDKCRSWTIKENIDMLKKYVGEDYKIIILERPVTEIVKSFARLYKENKVEKDLSTFLTPMSEPIMRSIHGLTLAKQEVEREREREKEKNKGVNKENPHFLFISYHELVSNPEDAVQKIYNFCGWEPFHHDYKNVIVKYEEDDSVYGLKGQHKVRPVVKKTQNPIKLTDDVLKKCTTIDTLLGYYHEPKEPPPSTEFAAIGSIKPLSPDI
jgi:sulfotransferase